ncbi:MAG: hypothetical protein ACLTMR_11305 [Faecalibacillus sp.]
MCNSAITLALSTFIDRKKYSADDKNLGISALFMGTIGITETAIPFAVKDMKEFYQQLLLVVQ